MVEGVGIMEHHLERNMVNELETGSMYGFIRILANVVVLVPI